MAASSLGRCCSLSRLRLCARTYLSKCHHPIPSKTPLVGVGIRWYSQEPESGYRYAKSHEWVSTGNPDLTSVGISDYAQEKLGDIVFVELPEVGAELEKGDQLGVLESVKAAADIYSPVGGTVAEVNSSLGEKPELVNKDSYSDGWLVKLKGVKEEEVAALMSLEEYSKHLEEGVV